jgi:hypothetical protein
VDETNSFLTRRGLPFRLKLSDHFPYRVAAARLCGISRTQLVPLAIRGLRFGGEPNPLRRIRDSLRVISSLYVGKGCPVTVPERQE